MSQTLEEIASQPRLWRRALEVDASPLPRDGESLAVVGCGTSWFIAQAYTTAREREGKGPGDAFTATEFPWDRHYDRVICLSRSGTTTEIVDVLRRLAERGTPGLLVTAVGGGPASPFASAEVVLGFADEESVAAMAAEVERVTGGLDLVVSNAGIVRAGSVLEQDASAFRLSTDINYVAFFLVTKHLGQLLARQHSTAPEWMCDIIQINSKSGLVGSNKNAAYAGSKFGGIGLVQSFALEMVEHGVKVNAICPGNFYDGPLWSDPDRGLFVQYLNSGKVPGAKTVADVKEFYEAKVPMRRGAQGIDVLRAIFYIVEQEYETGQAVPVTGGQVMLS